MIEELCQGKSKENHILVFNFIQKVSAQGMKSNCYRIGVIFLLGLNLCHFLSFLTSTNHDIGATLFTWDKVPIPSTASCMRNGNGGRNKEILLQPRVHISINSNGSQECDDRKQHLIQTTWQHQEEHPGMNASISSQVLELPMTNLMLSQCHLQEQYGEGPCTYKYQTLFI